MIVLCCTKRESKKGEIIIQIHEPCRRALRLPPLSHDSKYEVGMYDTSRGAKGLTGVTGRSRKRAGYQQNKSQRPG